MSNNKIMLKYPFKIITKKNKLSNFQKTQKKKIHKMAVAVLIPNKNNITGTVLFKEKNNGLQIDYNIKNLSDGKHGFHIHKFGDLTDNCTSACSHFNPDNKTHGGLNSKIRHAGDLGNIISKNKESKGSIFVKKLTLSTSKYNVLGRMIIVHEDEDDLGLGKNDESLKTGNAGKRLTCGVIGLSLNNIKNT